MGSPAVSGHQAGPCQWLCSLSCVVTSVVFQEDEQIDNTLLRTLEDQGVGCL